MSRYINQIKVPCDPNMLTKPIADYMQNEGFSLYNYKGTTLWKKGVGILTAPQYLAISYGPDFVQIEAFIKYPLFPGLYVGEMGITGFFGLVPKRLLASRVETIEKYIFWLWNSMQQPQPIQSISDNFDADKVQVSIE